MNPCEKCTRVPDPDACENKQCPDWRAWWFSRWEKTCLDIRKLLRNKEKQ